MSRTVAAPSGKLLVDGTPHLAISPHTSRPRCGIQTPHLAISPHISSHLPISPAQVLAFVVGGMAIEHLQHEHEEEGEPGEALLYLSIPGFVVFALLGLIKLRLGYKTRPAISPPTSPPISPHISPHLVGEQQQVLFPLCGGAQLRGARPLDVAEWRGSSTMFGIER